VQAGNMGLSARNWGAAPEIGARVSCQALFQLSINGQEEEKLGLK